MQKSFRTGTKSTMDVREVAEKYVEYMKGTDISIPDNVVTPQLMEALKQKGIPIEVTGKIKNAEEVKNSVREYRTERNVWRLIPTKIYSKELIITHRKLKR